MPWRHLLAISATATPRGNSQQAYSSRNKPPPLSELLPYRPRQINRRSRLLYERIRAAELQRQLGRPFSYTEKILASRVVRIEWELIRTDARLEEGKELSGHDTRGRLAAENRLRLDLEALGLAPAGTKRPTASEHLAKATTGRGVADILAERSA